MRPNTPGRSLLAAWIVAAVPVLAQSYQSSFSAVAFDRARTPTTLSGAVSVDAPSGAASLDVPLGPGIGRGVLKFRPTLSASFAPRVKAFVTQAGLWDMPPFIQGDFDAEQVKAEVVAANISTGEAVATSAGGASLSPGFFDLLCSNAAGGQFISNFQGPDGSRGSIAGVLPPGVNVASILGAFGYGAAVQVAPMPGRASDGNRPPFLQAGSNDELVLGLTDASFPMVQVDDLHDPSHPVAWTLPARILVVRGDAAYEYAYVNPIYQSTYTPLPRTHNVPNGRSFYTLRSAHYLINRVLNRFGESLVFDHSSANALRRNGIDYSVAWKKGSTTLETLSVKLLSSTSLPASPIRVLLDGRLTSYPNTKLLIQVSYPGTGHSSYEVEAYPAEGGIALIRHPDTEPADDVLMPQETPWDTLRMNLQPAKVVETATGAALSFRYAAGLPVAYVDPVSGVGTTFTPTVLEGVDSPGRKVDLTWATHPYRENMFHSEYQGFVPVGLLGRPTSFQGVALIQDRDLATGAIRETRHTRVVPAPDPGSYGWSSTAFYDAIRHPDGRTTVHFFISPVATAAVGEYVGGPGDTPERRLQTLGFLKHAIRETRHYPIGAGWQSDLSAPPSSSSASQVEIFDRWDLRRVCNPGASVLSGSVPYATRVQALNKDTGITVLQERDAWSPSSLAWTRDFQRAYPSLASSASEWCSRAITNNTSEPASSSYDRSEIRTHTPDFANWFLDRVTFQRVNGRPPVATAYNPDNTVRSRTVGEGGSTVTAAYTYEGELPKTVTLSGADGGGALAGSNGVGIAQYGYDGHGFLASIRQMGVSWSSGQANDGFGRPTRQTDPNGLSVDIAWDSAGRLSGLTPAFGDAATGVQYDPDQRGATVVRGQERSAYRYDGYGQLLLESRYDGSAWSHKRFEYDAAGRKRRETVWLPGQGSETESLSGAAGTTWTYDDRGRPKDVTDPNGQTTSTAYAGLSRTVTVAPNTSVSKSTTFTTDPLGRLVGVSDALGQGTAYAYDDADRLTRVTQSDPNTGATQVRQWGYNGLGWLTSLVQPESGTTSYAQFHVTGKPGRTTYPGGVVTSGYDSLGRITSTSGPGISQAFAYDQAGHGLGNGKLTSSSDSGVSLSYTYSGSGGRLSGLETTIPKSTGGPDVPPYIQSFAYDEYGRRTLAILDGRKQETRYQDATGQAKSVAYSGAGMLDRSLASITQFDTASWMPKSLSFPISGATTYLAYRADQLSLWTMAHHLAGNPSPRKQWTYQYDLAGRLRTDGEDSYGYDELDRLTSATVMRLDGSTVSQAFTYDAFGNQVSSLTSPVPADLAGRINNFAFTSSERLALGQTNRLPATANGVSTGAQYDGQGNMTRIYAQATSGAPQVVSLAYDLLGRVTELARPDGKVERYLYTPDGLRTRIEVWEGTTLKSVKHRLYNDQRQLVSEYEGKFAP